MTDTYFNLQFAPPYTPSVCLSVRCDVLTLQAAQCHPEAEAAGRFRRSGAYRYFEFSIDEDENSPFDDDGEDNDTPFESEEDTEERSQFYLPFSSTTSFWMFVFIGALAVVAFVVIWLAISCRPGEES